VWLPFAVLVERYKGSVAAAAAWYACAVADERTLPGWDPHIVRAVAAAAAAGLGGEDAPAAAALAVGVIAGLLLAHVGVGLRNTQQRYPRDYSPSPDTPE
jgi:hypothetical protein